MGDVELLVETVVPPGLEQTSGRLDRAGQKVVDGFERAQAAIDAIATRLGQTVSDLGQRGVHPDRMEVQFGLKFSAKGDVIVAGSTVEASLQVTVSYDRVLADNDDRDLRSATQLRRERNDGGGDGVAPRGGCSR